MLANDPLAVPAESLARGVDMLFAGPLGLGLPVCLHRITPPSTTYLRNEKTGPSYN